MEQPDSATALGTAFMRLQERMPTDTDRVRLYRVRDSLGLKPDDQLWNLIIALDYHLTLYREIPDHVGQKSEALVSALNEAMQSFGTGQERVIADFERSVRNAAERGVSSGFDSTRTAIVDLQKYLVHGQAREALLAPLRSEAESSVRTAIEQTKNEAAQAIRQVRDQSFRVLADSWSRVSVPWMLAAGVVLMLVISGLEFYNFRRWSGASFDAGYWSGEREQQLRETAFYQGLDRDGKALVDRRNSHIARAGQLSFR
jgi:hypothetical protein